MRIKFIESVAHFLKGISFNMEENRFACVRAIGNYVVCLNHCHHINISGFEKIASGILNFLCGRQISPQIEIRRLLYDFPVLVERAGNVNAYLNIFPTFGVTLKMVVSLNRRIILVQQRLKIRLKILFNLFFSCHIQTISENPKQST